MDLFGFGIKVMFSALYGNGFMGFAQIDEINTKLRYQALGQADR